MYTGPSEIIDLAKIFYTLHITALVGYALADKAIHPPDLDHKSTIYNFDNLGKIYFHSNHFKFIHR